MDAIRKYPVVTVTGTIVLAFLFLATVGLYAQYGQSPPSATGLSCDGKGNAPRNVRTFAPMFSWQFSDADAGDAQTKYRLVVGTSPGASDMWDSLIQTSGTSTRMYGGLALAANTTYYWAVQVWDRAGLPSADVTQPQAQATFAVLDIGLRVFDGTSTIEIAADRYLSTDPVTDANRLRISKSGQNYSIVLVDPSEYDASKVHISVPSGTKALGAMVAPLPAIGLSLVNRDFSGLVGGANPAGQTVSVSNVGGPAPSGLGLGASISYGSGSGWLAASFDSPTAPATLTVTPSTGSMAGGIYSATVAVASNGTSNGSQGVNVTLSLRCTVTYAGNGNTSGNVPIDANTYLPGNTVTVQGNSGNLVKTGQPFVGWNTQADGNGTSYLPGDTFIMGGYNVTLHARWLPIVNSGSKFVFHVFRGNAGVSGWGTQGPAGNNITFSIESGTGWTVFEDYTHVTFANVQFIPPILTGTTIRLVNGLGRYDFSTGSFSDLQFDVQVEDPSGNITTATHRFSGGTSPALSVPIGGSQPAGSALSLSLVPSFSIDLGNGLSGNVGLTADFVSASDL